MQPFNCYFHYKGIKQRLKSKSKQFMKKEPFKCSICNANLIAKESKKYCRAYQKSSLRKEPFKCGICNANFITKESNKD